MSISNRNRYFTSPPDQHSQTFIRGWANEATSTGVNGGLTTGLWTPVALDPSGRMLVSISNATFTGNLEVDTTEVQALLSGISGQLAAPLSTGSYSFVSSGITGSQGFIPLGALSWSAYVESGNASINGITYNTFESIMGGGYDGQKKLGSPIVVGCTGTAAAPCRLILNWEV